MFVFFNDTATTEIYTYLHTLSLHDDLPIFLSITALCETITLSVSWLILITTTSITLSRKISKSRTGFISICDPGKSSVEHTSELQSLMRISYPVFCLQNTNHHIPLSI